MMARNSSGGVCGAISQNSGHATSVPKVPGATGARPAPNPSARKCDGLANIKRSVGRALSRAEVIKAALRQEDRTSLIIDDDDTVAAFHCTDARNRDAGLSRALLDPVPLRARSGERQLVIV